MYYVYTIIRKDIPLADQIVQACHASYHSGDEFGTIGTGIQNYVPSLVLLEIDSQKELLTLSEKLEAKDIPHYKFFEPDDDLGYTALSTALIKGDDRKAFSNLRLWRA